ncbi:uncharacterized protein F4812DRAFT_416983 [Daldinia caldariorum]|uniref:uncharacterized protein n=1 Tax=Daldinia caldariorum TaxID=326644 RepID=UPI0020087FC6|nr:uncharacterized protein F4812DRAFT_416983 [Daldinia caldariorum]KAI1470302.1 hypothetical protein F4812DRAFT_416983 [Daldinia caldariorum]
MIFLAVHSMLLLYPVANTISSTGSSALVLGTKRPRPAARASCCVPAPRRPARCRAPRHRCPLPPLAVNSCRLDYMAGPKQAGFGCAVC